MSIVLHLLPWLLRCFTPDWLHIM